MKDLALFGVDILLTLAFIIVTATLFDTGVKTHELFMFGVVLFFVLQAHNKLNELKNPGK
jgi:phage-related holin